MEISPVDNVLPTHHADYFHLLYHLLKTLGNNPDLTQLANKKLCVRPKAAMNFPSRDVDDVVEEVELITLNCHFMGLYGVDSPLPMYFNAICLRRDELGQVIRDFLDVFNHRNYILYFLSWVTFQPEKALNLGDISYLNFLKSLAGHSICNDTIALANSAGNNNLASLYSIINHLLPSVSVSIHELIPTWLNLEEELPLGNLSLGLGDNMLLGNRIYDCSSLIRIELGPLTWDMAATIFPGGEKAVLLIRLLNASLENINHFELQFKIMVKENCLLLGTSSACLGRQTWLGNLIGGNYVVNLSERIYA